MSKTLNIIESYTSETDAARGVTGDIPVVITPEPISPQDLTKVLLKKGTTDITGTQGFDMSSIFDMFDVNIGVNTADITILSIHNDTNVDMLKYNVNKGFIFDADIEINGNITQRGDAYETHAEQVYTKKDFVILRDGAITGLANGEISGFKTLLADGFSNTLFGVDNSGLVKVGKENGQFQTLATRDDGITDGNGVVWNVAEKTFKDAGYKWALRNGDSLQDFKTKELKANDLFSNKTYVSGILGSGFHFGLNTECDNLSIREGFTCNTFINNKINIQNGDMIVSDSATILTAVWSTDHWKITSSENLPFKDNQILRFQNLIGNTLRYYKARISAISWYQNQGRNKEMEIVVTDGINTPQTGDLLTRWSGGLLYLNSSDDVNGAYLDVALDGVTKTRIGNLSGINDIDLGQLNGYGIFTENGYFKGSIVSKDGKIGSFDIDANMIRSIGGGLISPTGRVGHISMSNTTTAYGSDKYFYNGGRTLKGFSIGSDTNATAYNLVMGQMMDSRNTYKTNHYGIQMMDNTSKEYFALGFNTETGSNYNKIAGWNFDNEKLSSINNELVLDSATSSLKFHNNVYNIDYDDTIFSGLVMRASDNSKYIRISDVLGIKIDSGVANTEIKGKKISIRADNVGISGEVDIVGDLQVTKNIDAKSFNGIKMSKGTFYSNTDGWQTVTVSDMTQIYAVSIVRDTTSNYDAVKNEIRVSNNTFGYNRDGGISGSVLMRYVAWGV